eukprot:RCo018391
MSRWDILVVVFILSVSFVNSMEQNDTLSDVSSPLLGAEANDVFESSQVNVSFGRQFGVNFDVDTAYRKLLQEKGCRKLIEWLEQLLPLEHRAGILPAPSPNQTCSSLLDPSQTSELSGGLPRCLSKELFRSTAKWISFEQFAKGPSFYGSPASGDSIFSGYDIGRFSDFAIGEDPARYKNRSIILVNTNSAKRVATLRGILPILNVSFFLIHCGDHSHFDSWILRSPKILRVFACNVPYRLRDNPKVVPFPLGLKRLKKHSTLTVAMRHLPKMTPTAQLFVKFSMNTPVRRQKARKRLVLTLHRHGLLSNLNDVGRAVPLAQFYRSLMRHRFVVSPTGNGIDCYRTWEALALGRPPVVVPELHPFVYEGLPVLTVPGWEKLNSTVLDRVWARLGTQRFNANKLLRFWWALYILLHVLEVP